MNFYLNAARLLAQYENKQWEQVIPGGKFPKLLHFHDTRDYVRQVLGEQVLLTANREDYAEIPDSLACFGMGLGFSLIKGLQNPEYFKTWFYRMLARTTW